MTSENTSEPQVPIVAPPAPPRWRAWWENIQILIIALILALLIRVFIAEPRFIPSDSMLPTLEIGDRLIVEKLSYRLRPPEFGEIVVFDPPQQLQIQGYTKDQAFIKRIIGQPGQTVQVNNGTVFVNQQPLQEPYIAAPPNYTLPPVTVPDGEFFVMGDNRNNSNDSHVWGFLPQRNIIGRAWLRFYPFDRLGLVEMKDQENGTEASRKRRSLKIALRR
jgi:signal peptidase I